MGDIAITQGVVALLQTRGGNVGSLPNHRWITRVGGRMNAENGISFLLAVLCHAVVHALNDVDRVNFTCFSCDIIIIGLQFGLQAVVYFLEVLRVGQFDDVRRIFVKQNVVAIYCIDVEYERTGMSIDEVHRLSENGIVAKGLHKLVERQVHGQADGEPLAAFPLREVGLHVSSQVQLAMHVVVGFVQLALILIDQIGVVAALVVVGIDNAVAICIGGHLDAIDPSHVSNIGHTIERNADLVEVDGLLVVVGRSPKNLCLLVLTTNHVQAEHVPVGLRGHFVAVEISLQIDEFTKFHIEPVLVGNDELHLVSAFIPLA